MKKNRPIGVSIIAILQIIGSLLLMAAGMLVILGTLGVLSDLDPGLEVAIVGPFGIAVILAGLVILLIGFIIFLIARGLWNLNKTSWYIEEILFGLSTLGFILNFEIIINGPQDALTSSIVSTIIFIYLFLVRGAFNKGYYQERY